MARPSEAGQVRLIVTLLISIAMAPALAQTHSLSPAQAADPDPAAPARPPTVQFRATQINRCPDPRGNVILQDTPCTPVRADAAGVTTEVIELSSLAARPPANASPATAQDTEAGALSKGLINGSWKLALLVLACYILVRVLRFTRDHYRAKHAFVEPRSRGPRHVR